MKIRVYSNYYMIDMESKYQSKIANYEKDQSTKPPIPIILRLVGKGGKKGCKQCKTLYGK